MEIKTSVTKNGFAKGRTCKICRLQRTKPIAFDKITEKLLSGSGISMAKFVKNIVEEFGIDIIPMNVSRHKKHMFNSDFVKASLLDKNQKIFLNRHNRVKENASGVVYFIKVGKYHKIGSSLDFEQRMKIYKTHNPEDIVVVYVKELKNYRYHEKVIHDNISHKKVRGEWFNLNNGDIGDVINYLSNY